MTTHKLIVIKRRLCLHLRKGGNSFKNIYPRQVDIPAHHSFLSLLSRLLALSDVVWEEIYIYSVGKEVSSSGESYLSLPPSDIYYPFKNESPIRV